MAGYQKVSFAEAKALMDAGAAVADVRDENEYLTGHAEGAILLPLHTITAETAGALLPDKAAPVLVYCHSGLRSYRAAALLARLGYSRVYDIGSLTGWPYGLTVEE